MSAQQNIDRYLRPTSLHEMAKFYGVCDRTFKKWVKPFSLEIGERCGRYYTISQVKTILERIGLPANVD
jgi:hypothetical protein